MAKVLFLQQTHEEWLGVMYLSAMLKARGHDCDILVGPLEKEGLETVVLREKPEILAVSCLTSDYRWAILNIERIRREYDPLVVFGGIHPTLDPEQAIADPNVDVICRGEGEFPLAELADAVDAGDDFSSIANLWVKTESGIRRNEMRNLTESLDCLPFPDRRLYTKYPFFQWRGKRSLLLGRGCPFACTHCHNSAKREVFKDKGKYVRWRSRENIMAEIDEVLDSDFVTVLHFVDDSFGANQGWLVDLVRALRVGRTPSVALQANMRADLVTDELCQALGEYGADKLRLRIAVETGNEDYRRRILKKNISDEVLVRAADTLNRYGIDFVTYNMLGLPGESYSEALETLRFNCRLKPALALCFVFQPFPGTELAKYAVSEGFLPAENLRRLGTAEYGGFFHSRSPLCQPEIEAIENLHAVFGFVVSCPVFFPLAKALCRITVLSPAFRLFYRGYLRWILWRRKSKDAY
jgi:radical SAM superfamily enzyme YgiQ (UPF0313 family)